MSTRSRSLYTTLYATLLVGLYGSVLLAGEHPLTRVRSDAVNQTDTLDFTVSLDWDSARANERRNRAYLEATFRQFARSVYTLSEGRHWVGRLVVYDNRRFLNQVDIQFLDKEGRASASINGMRNGKGYSIDMYTTYDGRDETPIQLGQTLAHEVGHYSYGLFDEYREAGKRSGDLGDPQAGDTPRPTIMNSHEEFVRLSVPDDYADPAVQRTAHWRVYRQSAWETLLQDPARDPAYKRQGFPLRLWFPAFRSLSVPPRLSTLQQPQGGEEKLRIVYNPTTVVVLILHRETSEAALTATKNAARQVLDNLDKDTYVAVLASSEGLTPPVYPLTLLTDAQKPALQAAIEAITVSTTAGDTAAALDAALSVGGSATQDDRLITSLLIGVPATTRVPSEVVARYEALGASIQVIARTTENLSATARAQDLTLAQAAQQTQGAYKVSDKDSVLLQTAAQFAEDSEGDPMIYLNAEESEPLTPERPFAMKTVVGTGTLDGPVQFTAYWSAQDSPRIGAFILRDPHGQPIDPLQLPAGIQYERADAEGYATYTVAAAYPRREGLWISTVASLQPTQEGVIQVVETDESLLSVDIDPIAEEAGDTRPLMIAITVRGPQPVVRATATVSLYDAQGQVIRTAIPARDDGTSPDGFAADGVYTAVTPGQLAPGDYDVWVQVDNPLGRAAFSTVGRRRAGTDAPPVPTGRFMRAAVRAIALESPSHSDDDGIPDELEDALGTVAGIKDNDVYNRTDLRVYQLYRDLLNREADEAGLSYWQTVLREQSTAVVIQAFLGSAEFDDGRWLPWWQLYQAAGIAPSVEDVRDRRQFVDDPGVLARQLVQSIAFQETLGPLDDTGYIQALYRHALKREADAAGLSFWRDRLVSGDRAEVLLAFALSEEAIAVQDATRFVSLLYLTLLQRTPDTEGLTGWVNWLNHGGGREQLITVFFNSPEYRSRFL